VHQCHLGFDVVAAPIWLAGELVGFVFTGGSLRADPTLVGKSELLRKVREFAEIEGDADRHVADVPRLPDSELERLRDLVVAAAVEVIRQAPRFVEKGTRSPRSWATRPRCAT
jgi:Sensory domain found in PocR